jgi:outer membrane lipoprotein-sorting protein
MKFRSPTLWIALSCAFLCGWPTAGRAESLTLDQILTRMDRRGATLQAMSCLLTQKKWTAILEEFDRGESGRFFFLKKGAKVYLRKDITLPQANTLVIADGNVLFYQPKIKQAQRYNLGQHRDKAEFLLLGFGSKQASMKDAYKIRLAGEETVRGKGTYVLELAPKSDKVSAFFSQIVLWIDSASWVPIQQKLVEPTRDYLLIEFEEIQLNPALSPSLFDLKLPKDVKVVTG